MKTMVFKKWREFFSGGTLHESEGSVFLRQRIQFSQIQTLIRAFYAAMVLHASFQLPEWESYLGRGKADPLWPVSWLSSVDQRSGILFILVLWLSGAVMAVVFTEKRWARGWAFLGFFFFAAFNNSFGKIGHSLHHWVLISFLLIFLPSCTQGRMGRQRVIQLFIAIQFLIGLTYTMAGIGKIGGIFLHLFNGEMSPLHPYAMSYIVAERLLQTNTDSLFGAWFVSHPYPTWIFLLGAFYLQFASLWFVARPVWHRAWAVGVALFHIFSYFTFTIIFPQSVFVLLLFFGASPFTPDRFKVREMIRSIPFIPRNLL
ncbi:MAG: hypothetical protein V4507_00190 [Verrucomicrobiota bacterium]